MTDDWSQRKSLLEVTRVYKALGDFSSPAGSDFRKGEHVRLARVGWSRYDGAHVYVFEGEAGREKTFWLSDSEPVERLTRWFEPAKDPA